MTSKEIPIFFATDDNYAAFLAVALKSILDNASKDYFYKIHVLNTGLTLKNKTYIKEVLTENASLSFVNVKEELDKISSMLHLRDYYSKATYYRFFIAKLFPQYTKVLYLDCDIIVKGDISELYNTDISDKMLAGVTEEVMPMAQSLTEYAEKVLGVPVNNYFNAGILLINVEKFREYDVLGQFLNLVGKYKFRVAQDQDYLNIICKDKVHYLDYAWNKTPVPMEGFDPASVKIAHFKINWKPWHYDNILYGDVFWEYTKKTSCYPEIKAILDNYSDFQKKQDSIAYDNLVKLAADEVNDTSRYYHAYENNEVYYAAM